MSTTILCPTRGGQDSYLNQDYAISLTKERDGDLIFLYVSNVQFLDHTAAPKVVDIEEELDEMGDFMLTMAIERAHNAGIQASSIVTHGQFGKILVQIIQEHAVDVVVLGMTRVESSHLPPDYIEKLAMDFSREMEIDVRLVHEGELFKSFKG
jgi:nucleotide-binding universal stress UspA family protein